jgi:hypothetical protein
MNSFAHLAAVAARPKVAQSQLSATGAPAGHGYASRLVAVGTLLLDVAAVVGICVLAGTAVVIAVMITRLHRDANVSRASLTSRVAQIKWAHFALAGVGLCAALTVVQDFIASHQDWVAATLGGAPAVPTLSQVFAGHFPTVVVLLLSAPLVVISLVFLCRAIGSTMRLLRPEPKP